MTRGERLCRLAGCALVCSATLSGTAAAQILDDIKIQYAQMKITEAKIGSEVKRPVFYRHFFDIEFGIGNATFGATYQVARKDRNTADGVDEEGLMLTSGYNRLISSNFRMETFARIGVSRGNDDSQPLYATDTDFRINLVGFLPDGLGQIGRRAIFPSAYTGAIVNKYGRLQGILGVGAWWSGIGLYATGFKAFNGVADPLHPGGDANKAYANLENSGVTFGLTYEFRDVLLWAKRNFAIKNGGNDFIFSLQYRYYLKKEFF